MSALRSRIVIVFLMVLIIPVAIGMYFLAEGTDPSVIRNNVSGAQALGVIGLIAFIFLRNRKKSSC